MSYFVTPSEDPNRFLMLLVVLLLAFLVPILLSRFKQLPVVVGEIIAGIIIGPSILGWVVEGPILTFMSDIGLAFLMFLAGIEINFGLLFPSKRDPSRQKVENESGLNLLRLATWAYALTLLLAFPSGYLLRLLGLQSDPWLLAFVLSATSLGVLLPILKERRMLGTNYGQVIFITATLADFVTVILLTIHIITFDRGFEPEIFAIGLLFIAFLFFYRWGPPLVNIPAVRRFFDELSQATVQIKVRGAIAIMMAFVVLAEFVNAELILGAFLGGMVVSLLKSKEDEGLVHKLEAFGFGFFIPVFFILVGVNLEIGALLESPESLFLLPLILAISLVVKILPMLFLKRHFTWKEVFSSGLLLNTHLSLEIAVSVIGLRAGLLDPVAATTIILFAIITVVLMPLLFNMFCPDVQEETEHFMAIVGANETGLKVADELSAHGDMVKFIEDDVERIKQAHRKEYEVIEAPPTSDGIEGLVPAQVQALLVLSEDDERNLAISRKAEQMGFSNVVAYVVDPVHLPEFQSLNVQVFTPAVQRITMITMMARNPHALNLFTSTSDNRDVTEMQLRNRSVSGMRMRELNLPGDSLVLSIRRNGQMIVPRGNTRVEVGDRLTLVGNLDDLSEIRNWLEWQAGRGR